MSAGGRIVLIRVQDAHCCVSSCGIVCLLSCLILDQNNHCYSEPFTSGAGGRVLLFGFKNRTFKLDFYGLVNNAVLMLTNTWSLPLPGPIQLPRTALSGPLSRDLVPGQSVDHPRKCHVDSALRYCWHQEPLVDLNCMAYMFLCDCTHSKPSGTVRDEDRELVVKGKPIFIFQDVLVMDLTCHLEKAAKYYDSKKVVK
ncbi:Glyceraldehyde-3-Phosphate Dehydrogenase [Manis pentadactyla]|nr:Glyceraldehyde-3-Phosphate Dehydrogenase [Manis pentadactyla]